MSIAINGTNGITYNDGSLQPSAPVGQNLIINGDMAIDQRNAGAALTITGDNEYGLDRWVGRTFAGAGRFSMEQVADAPSGFTKSNKITVTTTATSGAGGYGLEQRLEGNNLTMLNYGTANAQPLTASFWIKASVVGTYSCALRTSTSSVSGISHCVNTFTISTANTWQKVTIPFPANTAYDTVTNTSTGIFFDINFGAQTAKTTSTLNTWALGNFLYATGQTDVMQTSGATINITGVQLEVGTTATPFENLPYTQQLALCQRYYWKWTDVHSLVNAIVYSPTSIYGVLSFNTTMRAAPTFTVSSASHFNIFNSATAVAASAFSASKITKNSGRLNFTASSARTQGQSAWIEIISGAGKYIQADSEI